MINTIARIVALILSCSSGTISVFGLATIFSGAYYPTIAVGAVLEMAKIVSAAWLQIHWYDVSKKVRNYLCFAVIVLMVITSIGIYGFFARAHIDQNIAITTGDASKIPLIDGKIFAMNERIKDVDNQIEATDKTLRTITEKSRTSNEATASLNQIRQSRANRDRLRKERETYQTQLVEFETEKMVLINKVKRVESDIGPIRYVANLFYGNANQEQLENAVRWLIIVIMSVFDPLSVILIIATSVVSKKIYEQKNKMNFVVRK